MLIMVDLDAVNHSICVLFFCNQFSMMFQKRGSIDSIDTTQFYQIGNVKQINVQQKDERGEPPIFCSEKHAIWSHVYFDQGR